MPEDDGSRGNGVERRAGHVRPDPRDADDEGVERRVDRRAAQLDGAHERLGVRDRGRAGEDGGSDQRAVLVAEQLPPETGGQGRVDPAQRRRRYVRQRRLGRRIVAEPTRQPRVIEERVRLRTAERASGVPPRLRAQAPTPARRRPGRASPPRRRGGPSRRRRQRAAQPDRRRTRSRRTRGRPRGRRRRGRC